MVFRPSPTQSPAAAATVIGQAAVAGHEFNTTLVGSNNISLNKVIIFVFILRIVYYNRDIMSYYRRVVNGYHNSRMLAMAMDLQRRLVAQRRRRKRFYHRWLVVQLLAPVQ